MPAGSRTMLAVIPKPTTIMMSPTITTAIRGNARSTMSATWRIDCEIGVMQTWGAKRVLALAAVKRPRFARARANRLAGAGSLASQPSLWSECLDPTAAPSLPCVPAGGRKE